MVCEFWKFIQPETHMMMKPGQKHTILNPYNLSKPKARHITDAFETVSFKAFFK